MTATGRVIVRRAHARDLDAIVAMRLALLRDSKDNPAYRRLRDDFGAHAAPVFAAQLADKRCLTLVAVLGHECVGMLRCSLSVANPLYAPGRHAYVMSAYVRPEHRRRGVTRALLQSLDDWCAGHGVTEVRLHCGIDNEDGNAAWRALGFASAETLYVRHVPPRGLK